MTHLILTLAIRALIVVGALSLGHLIFRALIRRAKERSSEPNVTYKVYFNCSHRFTAKTPLRIAHLTFDENGIELNGGITLSIQFSKISSLRLESPHSPAMRAHVMEIKYGAGEIIYIGVLRAALFKILVINNLLRTVTLFETVRKNVPKELAWSALDARHMAS
jgi:hypothetical protein